MPLARSATSIYCQTCASAWPLTDAQSQYYFASSGVLNAAIGSYTSPKEIADADPAETMTFCPKCDVDPLAESYRKPAPGIQESPFYERDSRMIGSDPDGTDGDVPEDDADVVHRV